MPAMPVAERMTAKEFLALPPREEAARIELVNGELVVSEASPFHATLQGRIFFALELWVRAQPLRGRAFFPIDVGIDEHNVYIPDVLWYAQGRAPGDEDRPSPPPGLAVEIRSPSTWSHDVGPKRAGYERRGVAELWLVDTAAEVVLAFRRSRPDAPEFDIAVELGGGEALQTPLLPGFSLDLGDLFERS